MINSVLITGGAGYLGSHLLEKLSSKNINKIIIVDNFSNSKSINKKIFKKKIIIEKLNICNFAKLKKVFQKYNFEIVYHFAAKIDATESFRKKKEYYNVNYNGTKNIVKLCNEFFVKKLIFASSAAVYGNTKSKTCKETDLKRPINPYGVSKLKAENYIIKNLINKRYYILRFFNMAGSSINLYNNFRHRKSIFFKICNFLINKKRVFYVYKASNITRDSSTERDFIHVNSVVSILLNILKDRNPNCVVNVGNGKKLSILKFLKSINSLVNNKINIKIVEKKKGDPSSVIACTKRLNKLFTIKKYNDNKKIIEDCYKLSKKIVN